MASIEVLGCRNDDTVDNAAILQSLIDALPHQGAVAWRIPPGTWAMSAGLVAHDKIIKIVGDGRQCTFLTGTFTEPFFSCSSAGTVIGSTIESMTLINNNGHGIKMANCIGGAVRDVEIYTPAGISIDFHDSFSCISENCNVKGGGDPDSIGVLASSHAKIIGLDCNGHGHGIRAYGPVVTIDTCRVEVCYVGLMLGMDNTGGTYTLAGSLINGASVEACDIGWVIKNMATTVIAASGALGDPNSASGPSTPGQIGLDVAGAMTACEIRNFSCNGDFSTAAIRIQDVVHENSGLYRVRAQNNLHPELAWLIPDPAPVGLDIEKCNN